MAAASTPSAPPPGSLGDRLVEVTLALVADEGIESLSLRRIARRAGVSHSAPLRHFESLSDLLAEVAAHGFRLLRRSLDEAAAALPPGSDPVRRLHAAGHGYVKAAVDNPELFTLMFSPDRLNTDNERFQADSAAAFNQLLRHVGAAQDAGWQRDRDTRLLSVVVWSSLHGMTSLWSLGAMSGPGPRPGVTLEAARDLGLELFLGAFDADAQDQPQANPEPTPRPDGRHGDPS